jgi:hypothetical protein
LGRFAECFSPLIDPRKNQAQHDLTEMLFIALLATLSGATTCCDIALFGRAKEALLRTILVLEHGIPSHPLIFRQDAPIRILAQPPAAVPYRASGLVP